MTKKELMEELKDLPDDIEILLDDEGNGYSHLNGIDANVVCLDIKKYRPEEVYSTEDSASDNCMDEEEWEEIKKLPRVGILF